MKTKEDGHELKDKRDEMGAEDLFDEMSVVELEERLELAGRCVCRNTKAAAVAL